MEQSRNIIISLILSTSIIIIGISGYMIIEGWSFLDSLYMTVITISTVGYREVYQMSRGGQMFTIALVFFGVGFTLYLAGAMVQLMVEARIKKMLGRRRLEKQIKNLKNHYIICGYGRIGRIVYKRLIGKPLPVIVIEKNKEMFPFMDEEKIVYMEGDASQENVLIKAGIKNAKGLIAALATDTDNVFLVLTARQLNPSIYIVARAGQDGSEKKLLAAGANIVESPYRIGGLNIAQRILRPAVTNFLEIAMADSRKEIFMEEIPVSDASKLIGLKLKDSGIRQKFNLILIAVKKPDGSMLFNPSSETVITKDEIFIAIGEKNSLAKLEKVLSPKSIHT